MSETPGRVLRRRAISSVTLCAGIWPPSPGFDPCAILICSSSAETAYSALTPNRPDATCLIFELRSSPKRSGFAALAGVRASSEAVERDRDGLVRFRGARRATWLRSRSDARSRRPARPRRPGSEARRHEPRGGRAARAGHDRWTLSAKRS